MTVNNPYVNKGQSVCGCVVAEIFKCKLEFDDQYTCDFYKKHDVIKGCKFQGLHECESKKAREKAHETFKNSNKKKRVEIEYK